MSEQPEALRLADALNEKPDSDGHCREAAAELRRLFELAYDQHSEIYGLRLKLRRLHEANQELLESLKLADALLWGANMNAVVVERKVKAAIAKATGEQK